MTKSKRIKKSILGLLSDLDDHLYLLRLHRLALKDDPAHIKSLSAELRVLACLSSGTEGLLWRMAEKLEVSDNVQLQIAGNVDKKHPLAAGLDFSFIPIKRAGFGHQALPSRDYSLKKVIKGLEAVYIGSEGLTHEYLIKAVAQQIGSAHEDDSVEIPLVELQKMFFSGVQPYVSILLIDSEFVLQIGERVLRAAEKQVKGFKRKVRNESGDFSIVIRMGYSNLPDSGTKIITVQSFISEVGFAFSLNSEQIICDILKHDGEKKTICLNHPTNWQPNEDIVIALLYSSTDEKIHLQLSDKQQSDAVLSDIKQIYAEDLVPVNTTKRENCPVYRQFVLTYSRLLMTEELENFLALTLTDSGDWKDNNGLVVFSIRN